MKFALKIFITALFLTGTRFLWDDQLKTNFKNDLSQCQKIEKLKNTSALVLGDSRALNGIDPSFINEDALNFAFSSNSYTQNYLDYILEHHSPYLKSVVIALSVQSMTDYMSSKGFEISLEKKCNPLHFAFDQIKKNPLKLNNLRHRFNLQSSLSTNFKNGYFSLGDEKKHSQAIKEYPEHYKKYPFNEKYINHLQSFHESLKAKGIKTLFILMPSKANRYDYDKKISGISKEILVKKFKERSIEIKEFDTTSQLDYVDGDHFTKSSSQKFSQWIAAQLVN